MFWRLLGVFGRPTLKIEVTQKDQKELARLLSGGVQSSCAPLALLELAKGTTAPRIVSAAPSLPKPFARLVSIVIS